MPTFVGMTVGHDRAPEVGSPETDAIARKQPLTAVPVKQSAEQP